MNNVFTFTTYRQPLKASLISLIIGITLLFTIIYSAKSLANKNTQKILIVISSDGHGYWLPEVLEPYQLLQQAGFEIDIASPKGGKGKISGSFRLSSAQEKWLEQSSLPAELEHSMAINNVVANNYQAIYFAGGSGPMFDFIHNDAIQKITASIYESGGVVSADCHGIAALLNVTLTDGTHLIAGKELTAKANHEEGQWARNNYPFLLEDKITELRGRYSSKAKGEPHVVVDDRLITGQNPASAIPMAQQLIQVLSTISMNN
jgi:putative intracellular protease/amidase